MENARRSRRTPIRLCRGGDNVPAAAKRPNDGQQKTAQTNSERRRQQILRQWENHSLDDEFTLHHEGAKVKKNQANPAIYAGVTYATPADAMRQ